MENDKIIHPETLTQVKVSALPDAYAERWEPKLEKKTKKSIEISPENYSRYFTPGGHRLSTAFRNKEAGGKKIILNSDFDEKKPWKTFYAKQLTEIIKPTSHEKGKIKETLIYTEEYTKVHATTKFEKVRQFVNELDGIRRCYRKDMSSKDETKRILALMVAMSDESAFRSGTKDAAERKKNPVFGITTLQARHFKKDGNRYKINFIGKDSVVNKKVIKRPSSVELIDSLLKNKDEKDYVFRTRDGHLVSENELNAYVKEMSDTSGISFHKFRHVHASRVFDEAIEEMEENGLIPDMPTKKELIKVVRKAAEKSAELLCNTVGASLKNYILPQHIFDLFNKYNVSIPDVFKKNVMELKDLPDDVDIEDAEDEEEEDEDEETSSVASLDLNDEELVIASVSYSKDDEGYYETNEKSLEEYEDKVSAYEHNDDMIFVDPSIVMSEKVSSVALVDEHFTPDFSDLPLMQREDNYDRNKGRSKELDLRTSVTKWGYNDYPLDVKQVREQMEERAKKDIERITKENEK